MGCPDYINYFFSDVQEDYDTSRVEWFFCQIQKNIKELDNINKQLLDMYKSQYEYYKDKFVHSR